MIFTARQLQDLHKTNGHIVLPYRARLTPMAQDWLRTQKLIIGYSDEQVSRNTGIQPVHSASQNASAGSTGKFLYWCDGPCGPAKAALAAQARESDLAEAPQAPDPKNLPTVLKQLSKEIREKKRSGGILLVQYGARAMIFANRCPSAPADGYPAESGPPSLWFRPCRWRN